MYFTCLPDSDLVSCGRNFVLFFSPYDIVPEAVVSPNLTQQRILAVPWVEILGIPPNKAELL